MSILRVTITSLLVAALAIGTAGCARKEVAARVNGEAIYKAELDQQVEKLKEMYPQMFEGADGEGRLLEFRQQTLNSMINTILWQQAAEERGVTVTDAQVQKRIDELKAGFPEAAQFEQALEQSGMTLEELKDQVRNQILTEALISPASEVSEEDVREFYEANKAQFTEAAAIRASHILFNEADKALAESVLAQIRDGADFAELARQHSEDPASASGGGDLGWPAVPYVPEFQQALEGLEINEISDLVQTQFGWHIIKAAERREERVRPLEEVTEQIEQSIIQQRNAEAYQVFLAELREKADIEILIPELRPPAETPAEEGGAEQP